MIRLLRVRGESLSPEVKDGDFVVTLKLPISLLQVGDKIVFRKLPYGILIKQVERSDKRGHRYLVRGSHPNSLDSRTFGAVQADEILGKVIFHISKS